VPPRPPVRLEKATSPPTCRDGEKAVELATAHTYDVVFMDIQMPGIDGLAACEQIHETKRTGRARHLRDRPVRLQHAGTNPLKGGADLMGKPFLVFEVTVRAMTYAMRRRLQAAVVNRRDMLPMTTSRPFSKSPRPNQRNKPALSP